MPVKRRVAKGRMSDVSEMEWAVLTDQRDERTFCQADGWEGFFLRSMQEPGCLAVPSLGDLWLAHRGTILADWIGEHPGTRPSCWWRWDGPIWADRPGFMKSECEPRRRLGGVGHANDYSFRFGLPTSWVKEGHPSSPAPDPFDPPMFESQAAYLDRHGLLLPGERRRLKPADFEPEVVAVD